MPSLDYADAFDVEGNLADGRRLKSLLGTSLSLSLQLFAIVSVLLVIYRVFIYARFVSPLRHLPGPKVDISLHAYGYTCPGIL